ncbi:MAG TPA: hypothetical protein VF713_18780, partial [Thermoanaerobaculia bacterium]
MRYTIAVAGLLFFVRSIAADPINDKTYLGFSFYKCSRPAGVTCMAPDPDRICKQCLEYGLVTDVRPATEALDTRRYLSGENNANKFLQDSLVELFHVTRDEAERFVPHKIADLYDDPQSYGWMKLDEMRPGAIILDRRKVAIILPDPSEIKPVPDAEAQLRRPPQMVGEVSKDPKINRYLLYPSAHRGGLSKLLRHQLFNHQRQDGEPRVIFPERAPLPVREATGTPPQETPERVPPLHWNTWIDDANGKRYHPLRFLPPNGSYTLSVHLGPYRYRDLYGVRASSEIGARIRELSRSVAQSDTGLKAVVVADESMLAISDAVYDLPLNLQRFRDWPGPHEPEGNPLD